MNLIAAYSLTEVLLIVIVVLLLVAAFSGAIFRR
jgi:hypothetical protein